MNAATLVGRHHRRRSVVGQGKERLRRSRRRSGQHLPRVGLTLALLGLGVSSHALGANTTSVTLFVSTQGNDNWSGARPVPNADHTDGPLATLKGARDRLRRLRSEKPGGVGPVTVYVRGGRYLLEEPFTIEPQDSGRADAPVVYEAYQGERPVFSGGKVLRGWKVRPDGLWELALPEVAAGRWYFRQLFVNGRRCPRARMPNDGFFTIAGKVPDQVALPGVPQSERDRRGFLFHAGDIRDTPDLAQANVVIFHSWEISRLRIARVDEAQRVVVFTGPANWAFLRWDPKQRYYVENLRPALDAPGEWYLDRSTGMLLYQPLPGQTPAQTEVMAPKLTRLLELRGDPDQARWVEHVTFRGLTVSHQDWSLEEGGHSDPQAAVSVPAAVMAEGARHCRFERCEISHVGDYALWLHRGCRDNTVTHCRLFDLGAGGVRVGDAQMPRHEAAESRRNRIDNNHIYDGGHVWPAGVGVWVAQSSSNVISHNDIHDLFYSGMSIGWNWNDAPNRCHHNRIEFNHVHHVMRGLLSDGGAIYTLGQSPGSVISNNVFHDVWPYHTPPFGWGIYLDATTSGYRVESNLVYHVLSGGMMYSNGGHENVIQNNIFALCARYTLWPAWPPRPNTFRRNIIYLTQGEVMVPLSERWLRERLADGSALGQWDANLYWHTGGPERLRFFRYTWKQWQDLGLDAHSLIADPMFVNAPGLDFRLRPDSPAHRISFQPLDLSGVGLYGDASWVNEPRRIKHPPTLLPPPPEPLRVKDGFESTPVGQPPAHAHVSGEENGASVRVTDEVAAEGAHSLKVTDSARTQPTWQPHFYYAPDYRRGRVYHGFDVLLKPGAQCLVEWRDSTPYPQCIGPRLSLRRSEAEGVQVAANDRVLGTWPAKAWLHVRIEAEVGARTRPVQWRVIIQSPGRPAQSFDKLPCAGAAFEEVHWVGFISLAATNTAFYLDNMQLEVERP